MSDRDDTVQTTLSGDEVDDDELVLSAYVGTNAEVFPRVLQLHVDDGSRVADVTYGKGVFWKQVPPDKYDLCATDIDPEKSRDTEGGIDCRELPHPDDSFDCVVLDPPYAEGFYRDSEAKTAGVGTHSNFRDSYTSPNTETSSSKYHEAVLDMYFRAGEEAVRVLDEDGTLIVKVQDEVSANTQHLTHIEVTNYYEKELDLYTKDLFVVVRENRPSVAGMDRQVHARKNHSYFMVFTR